MDSLLQFLRNLGTGRLLLLAGVGAGTIFFFVVVIGGLRTAPMSPLFTDLDPADAGTIVQRLETENIPYETDAGGRIIKVPQDQVDRLRLTLAGEGLTGGIVGKEIFDQESSFGRTSFELNVNYVRAIEGEIARTIKYIKSVSEARVHIVMPERRPFQREASEPSASIMIKTTGAGIGQRQAEAIQALVASAVPGLSPDRVTISDTSGRLLINGAEDRKNATFGSLEEARLSKEQLFRDKIEQLIGRRVGAGHVRAEVSVSMDMNRTTTSAIEYNPDNQVVLSQQTREEKTKEANSNGGAVTVGNNLPDAQIDPATQDSGSEKSEEVTNFENSKTETVTVKEPGEITQIRVAVLVDEIRQFDAQGNMLETTQPRTDTEIQQLTALVLSAIPYEEARGDQVVVQSMAFLDPPQTEEAAPEFNIFGLNKQDLIDIMKTGGSVIVLILVLLLVVKPLVSRVIEAIPDAPPPPDPSLLEDRMKETPAITGPGSPITAEIMALAARGDENASAAVLAARQSGSLSIDGLRADARIDVAQVEGRIQESAIKKVADIIRTNPDESVAIVRTWLYAD